MDGITSTGDLPLYVLDRLFDSFSDKFCRMLSELSDRAGGEMNTDNRSIFDRYTDINDDESDGVNPQDELRTVLSMLDDASLPEFDFSTKEKVSVNPNLCKV